MPCTSVDARRPSPAVRITLAVALGCAWAATTSRATAEGVGNLLRLETAGSSLALQSQKTPDPLLHDPVLEQLQAEAEQANARVQRLSQEAAAAWARVPQVRSLPDPMVGGYVFAKPMPMGPDDELRGSVMVNQTFPWLGRLHAEARQVAFEALSLDQATRAERLGVRAEVAAAWHRLYFIERQVRINEANQDLLRSLIDISTARLEVGEVTTGDVLLGTVELSRLAEEMLVLRQQSRSTQATLNRLLNRPADSPLPAPASIAPGYQPWPLDTLRELAGQYQPEIVAARLRTQATTWGVRVARLQRIPEVTAGYEHMFMADGAPWQVGATINVPLWRTRYNAIESEATSRHFASRFELEDVQRANEEMLADWLEQARAAQATADLYQHTILPQAQQTLAADQESYALGRVEFDRVIADIRNVITFETSYHRAQTELATAVARLEQGVGAKLSEVRVMEELLPITTEGRHE